MFRAFFLAFVAGAIFSTVALADQITLKNGDRLTGTIIKSDGKSLTIKSEFAGTVTVTWEAIEQISADQPLYLTLKDNQVLVGTVVTSAGKLEIRTSDAGTVTIAKDSVQSVRSKAEQTAYQAEIDRLRNPGLLDLWSGSVDTGLSLARGNSETNTFSLGMNAARTASRDKISVYATSLYAKNKNKTTGKSDTTANLIRGGARYDVNLSRRTFIFGFGDLEYNEPQLLDLRLVLGGGFGYHFLKTERTALDVFGGGAVNKEYFSNDPLTGKKNDARSSAEVFFGEELTHKLSGRTMLREKLVFFPNLTNTGEYRVNFDASVITNINKWLGWQLTFSDRYLSNPLPGTKANDVLLTTGLRVTFAK